ncbi:ATP-binding protein [Lederbergia lenta]|uniref:P-loop containing nucleoside triphosphate hydrolase n=1 Tax=Lederbergia lenta TaxID=1467 RepID=A0A2X4WCZ2_LEDLE|nr:AAA family ATPase [Lederbergia lenta]MCM3110525.1 AAA family ATPase [Lederbergia lenta]MEC2323909.1 AAA family ATPase [Lederbergia lenta]SQI61041.1 P-loop containing nucleoside triphosphate hydrolase [Lederbergia lenta]
MKLKSLHIYGYGKFIDFHIENLSTIQLFFGENEAGKSTIMSFIHSILFGFPGRQQSEGRYEPKTHAAYGGQIITQFNGYGEVKIERVKGKAAGDVTIVLEDGSKGGEELLHKLLNGMDRMMYQSIFSFNLQDLQAIQKLKGEDISRYLVAAGTVGTDVLLNAEQQFQKELDLLFKPGGRKPQLNEQLRDLKVQANELKNAKQKNEQYISIIEEKEKAEKTIETLESEITILQDKLHEVKDTWKKWPLIKEKELLEQSLEKLGELIFPVDGIARLEKYTDRLIATSSRMKALQDRIQKANKEIDGSVPMEVFTELNHRAEKIINERAWFEQLTEEIVVLQRNMKEYDEQAESIGRELHYPKERWDKLAFLDLGIDMKGKIKDVLQKYDRLHSRKEDLHAQLKLTRSEKVGIEEKCQSLENEMLGEEEFKQLQMRQKQSFATEQLILDKQKLESELATLVDQKSVYEMKEKERIRKKYMSSGIFLLLCLGLFIWSISTMQWMVAGFAILVIIYAFVSSLPDFRVKDNPGIFREIEKTQKQIQIITESVSQRDKNETEAVSSYETQLHLREEWKKWIILLEQLEQRIVDIEKQGALLNEENSRIQTELTTIKSTLGINSDFSISRLEDAFGLLRELVHILKAKKNLTNQLLEDKRKAENWIAELQSITSVLGINEVETNIALFKLIECIKNEQEKKIIYKEVTQKKSELMSEAIALEKEKRDLTTAINQLLLLAGTDNEEDFRKKAKQFTEMISMKDRIELLHSQLGKTDESVTLFQTEQEIKDFQIELQRTIEQQSIELEKLRNELASYRHQVDILEEGGTYTEKLHRFHQLRSIFNEEARNWAKYALAIRVLNLTMNKYKEERFPKVIHKAQEYFSFLTDGEYKRLYIQPDGKLIVERKDRISFSPVELSQGTGEQLYISIRFALVEVLKDDYSFPVIIDDGFVNFDKQRTDKMVQLITEFSGKTQVLFFTCHEHMKEYFPSDNIVQLTRKNSSSSIYYNE